MFLKNVLILLPICAALGQDAPTKAVEWGQQVGPWRLSISVDRSQYSVGEPIEVVGALKNVSDQPVLFINNTFSPFEMDVRLPMPSWIPWKPRAQPLPSARPQPGELYHMIGIDKPPGSETARKCDLSKLFDMSALGEYRIKFSTAQPTLRMADGQAAHENPKVTVTSNEITITVVAAGK